MTTLLMFLTLFAQDYQEITGQPLSGYAPEFRIVNLDAENALGKTTLTPEQAPLIEIDSAFFHEHPKHLKRLIYHELAHAFLGKDEGRGIMNDRRTFKKISDRELIELFK